MSREKFFNINEVNEFKNWFTRYYEQPKDIDENLKEELLPLIEENKLSDKNAREIMTKGIIFSEGRLKKDPILELLLSPLGLSMMRDNCFTAWDIFTHFPTQEKVSLIISEEFEKILIRSPITIQIPTQEKFFNINEVNEFKNWFKRYYEQPKDIDKNLKKELLPLIEENKLSDKNAREIMTKGIIFSEGRLKKDPILELLLSPLGLSMMRDNCFTAWDIFTHFPTQEKVSLIISEEFDKILIRSPITIQNFYNKNSFKIFSFLEDTKSHEDKELKNAFCSN